MKFSWKFLLLALIVLPAVIGTVRADEDTEDLDDIDMDEPDLDEDEDEEPDELEDIDPDEEEDDEDLDASVDAETTILIVDNENNEFPAGESATAIIGFHNIGSRPFFVKSVDGSYRFPQDFRYHMQNFSTNVVNTTVPAGEQATFMLKFETHASFDPREIGLVINVNYVDADESLFRDAVFNDTVSIMDADSTIQTSTILSYTLLIGILVYGGMFFTQPSGFEENAIERGTAKGDGSNEWLTTLQSPVKK